MQRMFDFLVACHAEGRIPKEIEVAIGRPAAGSVTSMSARTRLVRVAAHKLRKRLEEFYRVESPAARYAA